MKKIIRARKVVLSIGQSERSRRHRSLKNLRPRKRNYFLKHQT